MSATPPTPAEIASALEASVIGQAQAVRDMAIALAKRLSEVPSGNLLMIGSSGTGKTTLMRAAEEYLAGIGGAAAAPPVIRMHANVLADESVAGAAGSGVLRRLYEALRQRSPGDSSDALIGRLRHGIVLVDEIDKIRSRIGGEPNIAGIRAQEGLLTLIESEAVPLDLPAQEGGRRVEVDSRGLLFVAAGAFEGLYDAVYDRVTIGRDRGALKPVTVVGEDGVEETTRFTLRQWLRSEDLFDYGMSPQFLSRFQAVILLNDLRQQDLIRIFLDSPNSALHTATAFFERFGVRLALTPAAVQRLAREAAGQPRLGARAMNELFHRVIRDYEFDPRRANTGEHLILDVAEIEAALTPQ